MLNINLLILNLKTYILTAKRSLLNNTNISLIESLNNYILDVEYKLLILENYKAYLNNRDFKFSVDVFTQEIIKNLVNLEKECKIVNDISPMLGHKALYKIYLDYITLHNDLKMLNLENTNCFKEFQNVSSLDIYTFLNTHQFSTSKIGSLTDVDKIPLKYWYVLSIEMKNIIGFQTFTDKEQIFYDVCSSFPSLISFKIDHFTYEQFLQLLMKGYEEYYSQFEHTFNNEKILPMKEEFIKEEFIKEEKPYTDF